MKKMRWSAVALGAIALLATPLLPARGSPKPATVPPTQEIVILDPNADPLGRPAVRTVPGLPGVGGTMQIDIPQTVIVHRFYYTGDRSFQGPFLPGGPCIVSTSHPKTGERLYIPIQMTPGAPRVIYTSHAIEYDYGKHGITIKFCWLTGQPKVEYRNCMPMVRRIENHTNKVAAACKEFSDRSGMTQARQSVASCTKNVCKDTADAIGAVGKVIMMPIGQLGQMIPGAQMLQTTDEDRAIRLRDAQVQAAEKAAAGQNLSIPTNR